VGIFKKLKRAAINLIREEVTELSEEFRAKIEAEVREQAEAALNAAIKALESEVGKIADKIVIQLGKTIEGVDLDLTSGPKA
jgi:hypothetical protein